MKLPDLGEKIFVLFIALGESSAPSTGVVAVGEAMLLRRQHSRGPLLHAEAGERVYRRGTGPPDVDGQEVLARTGRLQGDVEAAVLRSGRPGTSSYM